MPAKVILKAAEGDIAGQEFVFSERTTCVVGRAKDCHPRLRSAKNPKKISRHHCLLDINPPDIRIRDFGSRNGTFVNDELIGKREKHQTAEEAAEQSFPEKDLKDGDKVRIQDTVFRVAIHVPVWCSSCWAEIPEWELELAEVAPKKYECQECRLRPKTAPRALPMGPPQRTCACCGNDVADEIDESRQGQYVCVTCRDDPVSIVQSLVNSARSGSEQLAEIKGYTIIRELGRSDMGTVCLARDDRTGAEVALKILVPEVAADRRMVERFTREATNMLALKHPNIVEFHCFGSAQGAFFFSLEYCAGGTVEELMAERGGTLPVDEAGNIALQALEALDYAHNVELPNVERADGTIGEGRGIIHRNVGPKNLFLSTRETPRVVKIGDYSLSKAFDMAGLGGCTRTGMTFAKPLFIPRQQVIDFRYTEPDADVWAVAASLYNMITGHTPRDFPRGKDPWQVVLNTSPVIIRARDRTIPERLAQVIDYALDDSKELHFKTAAEFKRALAESL